MPHGQPDFGAYAAKSTVFSFYDMAELAARLGAVSTYDRRGDVVWIEDFDGALVNWTEGGTAGSVVSISAAESLTKGLSCILQSQNLPTTNASIYRHNPLPVYSRIGCEIAFLPSSLTQDVRLDIALYDGTLFYSAIVYVSIDAQTITYYDSSGWVELASSVNLRRDGKCWHYLKLVIDYSTKKYVRFLLDNVEYDMSTIDLVSTADASAPMVKITVQELASSPGGSITVYVNHVILTQNEP